MKQFFSTLLRNLIGCFRGRMLLWHVIAIALTAILVTSGLDWSYFSATRDPSLRSLVWPGIRLGTVLPVLVPMVFLFSGLILEDAWFKRGASAVTQAAILGSLISSSYKALTGRG